MGNTIDRTHELLKQRLRREALNRVAETEIERYAGVTDLPEVEAGDIASNATLDKSNDPEPEIES